MAWQADQLQCALFTVPSAPQKDALELWPIATGTGTPEAFQKPSTSPLSGSFARGTVNDYQFFLSSNPGRIDLAIAPTPNKALSEGPIRIPDVVGAFEILRERSLNIVRDVSVVRLAFVANLTEIQDTDEQVAKRMTDLTQGSWFPIPPLDCSHQVNVRLPYRCAPELQMNRVITLSAGNYQLISQTFMLPQAASVALPTVEFIPIVSSKIDVNSASASHVLERAPDMHQENADEVLLLIEQGLSRLRG